MDGDLEQNIREVSEPIGIYDSVRRVLVNELLPIDLNTSEQKEGECCHFSFRGYVANVHKSDKKICWPFSPIHYKNNLDNDEDVLPAISVAQFRWWNCENCLLKDGVRKNDGLREFLEEDRAKISVPGVNLSAEGDATVQKLLVSSLPKGSTDRLLELMSMEKDHKSADSNGVGKIGGLCTAGIESSQHESAALEDQRQFELKRCRSFFKFKDAVVTGPCDGKAHGDVYTMIHNPATYREQIPDRRLDNNTPDSCIDPLIALIQQHGAPKNDGTPMHGQSTGDPGCRNCAVTDKNGVIIENEEDDHADQPCDGNGTVNRRKVQRTRALSDIIKSEVLRVSNSVSLTTEDEATCDIKDKEKNAKSKMVPAISVNEASFKGDLVEEVMLACKKHGKSKTVFTVSGDGPMHVDDQSSKRISTMKNNSKHTCKKYNNSQKITPDSADEATNTDDKDIRKPGYIENKVKNICKKHKPIAPSAVFNGKAPFTAVNNGKKKDKVNGETNHVPKEHSSVVPDKHKKKSKLTKKLERMKIEDEGSSLINWMKKTSKKVGAYKNSAGPKHRDSSEFSPRNVSPSDALSLRKKVRPTILGSGTKTGKLKRQKSSVEGHECLLKQKSDITEHSASQGRFQKVNTGNTLQKSAKISGSTAGSLNPKPPSLGRQIEKTTKSNKEEVLQPRDDRPFLIPRQKDSGSLRKEWTMEKQTAERLEQPTDASSVDGIPVEILMLLQENYKRRHSDESVNVKEGRGVLLIADIEDGKEGNSSMKTGHEASQEPHAQQQQQEGTTRTAQEETVKSHNKQRQQLEYTFRTDHEYDALIQPCKQQPQQRCQASSSRHYPLELELLSTSTKNHREESRLARSYQYDPDGKGNICMGTEYQASGKCKNLMNMRGKWDTSPAFSDFLNYRNVSSDGLDPRLISENANGFFLQDRDHLWVLDNNKQNHVHGCNLSSLDSTGDCVGPRASITLDTTFPGVQDSPTLKGKEALPKDAQAKRKRVMEEYEYMKVLDRKFAQLQNQEAVGLQSELPRIQPAREYDAGAVRPRDLPTNETISALNLLRMMDPAVCSTTPICVPSDKSSGKLSGQSNYAYDCGPKGSFRRCSTERIDEENKNPHQHSVNTNFYSPAPRLGVPVPFYLKDSTVDYRGQESRTPYYHPFMGANNGEARAYVQSNARNVGNQLASQSGVPPSYTFLSPMNLFCGKMVQTGNKDKVGGTTQARKNSCLVEICSINRNPADFTIPGEDNEYMTGYEELQLENPTPRDEREHLGYPENRRKRKALSLIATKGLLRS